MDKYFFRRQGSGTQQPLHMFAFLHGALGWLAALVQFTEEELKDAGVCIGDQRYDR